MGGEQKDLHMGRGGPPPGEQKDLHMGRQEGRRREREAE